MRIVPIIAAIAACAVAGWAEIGNIVVTEAASFQRGVPPPGSIASLFCTGLIGIDGIVAAGRYPLPLELAGVRVRIAGLSTPLFAVAQLNGYQQINLQVPQGFVWSLDVQVTVEQGAQQATVRMPTAASGEFFRLPDGSGAFQHAADYTLVSAGNPARAGEVVIGYLTGLNATTIPMVPTGQPAPADPLAVVDQVLGSGMSRPRFEIWMGEGEPPNLKRVAPFFLGLAPGFVGVYQTNFRVPEGLAAANQPVRVVQNTCLVPMFGNGCLGVYSFRFSRPVPMAVQ
jgi:uncharacterized protein (TIGR03437 family)